MKSVDDDDGARLHSLLSPTSPQNVVESSLHSQEMLAGESSQSQSPTKDILEYVCYMYV